MLETTSTGMERKKNAQKAVNATCVEKDVKLSCWKRGGESLRQGTFSSLKNKKKKKKKKQKPIDTRFCTH